MWRKGEKILMKTSLCSHFVTYESDMSHICNLLEHIISFKSFTRISKLDSSQKTNVFPYFTAYAKNPSAYVKNKEPKWSHYDIAHICYITTSRRSGTPDLKLPPLCLLAHVFSTLNAKIGFSIIWVPAPQSNPSNTKS